jgi:hypothetical protein
MNKTTDKLTLCNIWSYTNIGLRQRTQGTELETKVSVETHDYTTVTPPHYTEHRTISVLHKIQS